MHEIRKLKDHPSSEVVPTAPVALRLIKSAISLQPLLIIFIGSSFDAASRIVRKVQESDDGRDNGGESQRESLKAVEGTTAGGSGHLRIIAWRL